ncbi:MAG: hypothetical protein AMXMBFR53_28410 [Gemmatimonadota bacterium]
MSEVLGLPTSTILAWARGGLLSPQRGPRGTYVFSFQDVAVLRSARQLLDAEVPLRRVRQTLEALRAQLPAGRPLSAVHLSVLGRRVLVREDSRAWEPDTGQMEMDLDAPAASTDPEWGVAAPLAGPGPRAAGASHLGADALFDAALDLEASDPTRAVALYQRALDQDAAHAEAHLNLGRLLHEGGMLPEAEAHYRNSLGADPSSARAAYNLGVVLEDQGRAEEAERAYRGALDLDPDLAVAHFNLSRLHEAAGRSADALGHLASYKRILDRGEPPV